MGKKAIEISFFFEVIRVMVRAMGNDVNSVVGIPAPCPRSKRFGDKSPFTKHRSMESVRCVGQKIDPPVIKQWKIHHLYPLVI